MLATKKERKEILEFHKLGLSMKTISLKTGLKIGYIYKIIRDYNREASK